MVQDVDHIQYRNDMVDEALELMLTQFEDSEMIVKLNTVIAFMKNIVYNMVVQVGKLRLIDNASGVQLDEIGEELGIPRLTADDDDYRTILKIKAYRARTSGTKPEIVDILSRVTGTPKETIRVYSGIMKTVDIGIYANCIDPYNSQEEIYNLLPLVTNHRFMILAGKPLGFVSVFNPDVNAFGFGGVASVNTPAGQYGAGGGHVASLVDADK